MKQHEIYHALWSGHDSLKNQLVEVLKTIEECDQVNNCFELLRSADEEDRSPTAENNNEGYYKQQIDEEVDKVDEKEFTEKVQ